MISANDSKLRANSKTLENTKEHLETQLIWQIPNKTKPSCLERAKRWSPVDCGLSSYGTHEMVIFWQMSTLSKTGTWGIKILLQGGVKGFSDRPPASWWVLTNVQTSDIDANTLPTATFHLLDIRIIYRWLKIHESWCWSIKHKILSLLLYLHHYHYH